MAKLAGLPAAVVARAGAVLASLEAGEQAGALARLADDLPLFAATAAAGRSSPPPARPAVVAALDEVAADDLTPREALELLYRLKALAGGDADPT